MEQNNPKAIRNCPTINQKHLENDLKMVRKKSENCPNAEWKMICVHEPCGNIMSIEQRETSDTLAIEYLGSWQTTHNTGRKVGCKSSFGRLSK